jgi:SAM-dependent methyltransferase
MILPNNPALDVDNLMKRVRADAEQLRASGAIDIRRAESTDWDDRILTQALDRQRAVSEMLNQATRENAPRAGVPPRLARFGFLKPAMRFLLRSFNYAFKAQREFNSTILRASREMMAMQTAIGEGVTRQKGRLTALEANIIALDARVSGIERSHHATREYVNDCQARLDELAATLQILSARPEVSSTLPQIEAVAARTEFAHQRIDSGEAILQALSARPDVSSIMPQMEAVAARTEFAHQRIDSSEASIHALSTRLGDSKLPEHIQAVAERAEFAHQRVDSSEATLRALSLRLEDSPTRSQARTDLLDAIRDVERRVAISAEAALRNDAILRTEVIGLRSIGVNGKNGDKGAVDMPGFFAGDALQAALGDAFRGDRFSIRQRLSEYLPTIRESGVVDAAHPVFDIGSGRGEWLALLRDADIPAIGVELNELLAIQSVDAGLRVTHVDALTWLRNCAPACVGAITAFHVVEHLSFDTLLELLNTAQRALVPGGVIILETPDPRNIIVSTQTFFLDPTHRNPVPFQLLNFLLEATGYTDLDVRELHPPETNVFADDDPVGAKLNEFFSHAQDYAMIARSPHG